MEKNPGGAKFSSSLQTDRGAHQIPVQWAAGISGVTAARAWRWKPFLHPEPGLKKE